MEDIKVDAPFIRTLYNYDRDFASDVSGISCGDTMTQQQFKEECDINTIIRRFGLGYEMPQNFNMPLSGDFSETVTDFQTALNMVIEAQREFDSLPAETRDRFANDPARLIQFLENEENRSEAEKLGLLKEKAKPIEPMLVRMVSDEGTGTT